VTGTLAPPSDVLILGPVGPVTAVPKGQPEVVELKGTVASVDPSGRLVINSERGLIHVWVAAGADQRFKVGESVTVWSSVQAVDLVPASAPAMPAPAPVGSEHGDHAVVTGRIMGINPGGVLVVESPTGPIQVLATDSSRFKIGDAVQVRTTVRTAS
jgi:biotin-(acetyl-CoA carboxylase) ligase